MKFSIVQVKPVKGNIKKNIVGHKKLIDLALSNYADIIIFPELSLTGYEPTLAHSLAIHPQDSRLNEFQLISDTNRVTIGVGAPTRNEDGICISMIIFQPFQSRSLYSKKYLHPDEEDFFIHGKNIPVIKVGTIDMALAICYEISVLKHADDAFNSGAEIYVASVAKFVHGIDVATKRLSTIAKKYSIMVMMANCIGPSDGLICAGKTSAWNTQGELIAQLDDHHEGIILVDTITQAVLARTI